MAWPSSGDGRAELRTARSPVPAEPPLSTPTQLDPGHIGDLAELLARRILGSVDRREISEELRRSPDIDRLAEVARWLTLVGEQVPPCVRELIHRAEAGWQHRTCHVEGEEPFEL